MTEAERELMLAIARCVGHTNRDVKELLAAVEAESETDEGEDEGDGDGVGEEKSRKKAKKR